jgi:DNA polymerase-3 subunit delta'
MNGMGPEQVANAAGFVGRGQYGGLDNGFGGHRWGLEYVLAEILLAGIRFWERPARLTADLRRDYAWPVAKKPATAAAAKDAPAKGAKKPRAAKASDAALMLGREVEAAPPQDAGLSLYPPPIALQDVVGHPRALSVLNAALTSQRVHHAWIFHGPRGVGKFTTAMAFAATLLDPTTAPDLSGRLAPDPDSQVQRLLRAGTHPDLHVIRKELAAYHEDKKIRDLKQATIPTQILRDHLIEPAAHSAMLRNDRGVSKVFIIDEAELLSYNANAPSVMLKTLEEPDGTNVIILVTTNEERLVPTIRSRCQRVAFTPLDDEAMALWLRGSKVELPEEARQWLLRYAAGSPGELMAAIEGDLFAWQQRLDPMLAEVQRGKFSLEFGATMSELIEAWAKAHVEKNPDASKDRANHAAADQMFRLLSEHVRSGLRRGLSGSRGADDPLVTGGMAALDVMRQAQSYLRSNVQSSMVMEWLAAQWPAAYAGTLAASVTPGS